MDTKHPKMHVPREPAAFAGVQLSPFLWNLKLGLKRWEFNPHIFKSSLTSACHEQSSRYTRARVAVCRRVSVPFPAGGTKSSAPGHPSPSSALLLFSLPLVSACRYVTVVSFGLIDPLKKRGLVQPCCSTACGLQPEFDFMKRSSRGLDVIESAADNYRVLNILLVTVVVPAPFLVGPTRPRPNPGAPLLSVGSCPKERPRKRVIWNGGLAGWCCQ